MRIACLQFAPQVGDVDNNLNRADAVLSKSNPRDIDLLVLPELAFSGYNFKSLQHITPFLEPTAAGITSLWARTTALKYDCVVTVGYPEKVDVSKKWPTSPEYYNSAITVNADGETIANYRKSFLYYTDETWALEGPDGFYDGVVPGLGNVAMGICKWPTKSFERMDLNPYKFEAPWSAWEFAYHILHRQANLVVLSMAWLTREDARSYTRSPKDPDMDTLSYWLARLEPIIRAEDVGEIIVVFANRTGIEGNAVYAGTSCVIGIDGGEVKLYGVLGRGERELLVVDTTKPPQAKLVSEPFSAALNLETNGAILSPPPPAFPQPTSPDDVPLSIDEMLATMPVPLSPVEPKAAHQYFSEEPPKLEEIFASLISASEIGKSQQFKRQPTPAPRSETPMEDLSQYARPSSPKSRNASRTRMAVSQEPALIKQDLINEPAIVPIVQFEHKHVIPLENPTKQSPHSASEAVEGNAAWDNSHTLLKAQKEGSMSPRPRSTGW